MSKVRVTMLHGTQNGYKSHNRLRFRYKSSYLGSRWQCERVMGQTSSSGSIDSSAVMQWFQPLPRTEDPLKHFPQPLTILVINAHSHSRAPRWASISGKTCHKQPLTSFQLIYTWVQHYVHIKSQWLFNGIEEQRVNADEGWWFFSSRLCVAI